MMAVMNSNVLSSLVCILCVVVVPAVWAEYCTSYTDWNGVSHRTQQCSMSYYCCGDCTYKYCCRDQTQRITQSQQERCSSRPGVNTNKTNRPGVLLGSILGSVFPIILCVGLIICCVAPCCLCYKKCRKGGNRTHTVVQPPVQPHSPGGYQPDYPGYHPVPGFGDPMPPAPPPYSNPGYPHPAPYNPGMPMYPLNPHQVYAEPPQSDEHVQPPYNPSYDPNSQTS
ncbi:protein shisa-4-like [Amphiprion ocellaris]|uniref:protein shisa-4-like n=1 Tax=Amphiprion ocellaris TaxID=80972 RepID=UPI0024112772|nr:protein shisa-4-like [Amphiprion ocellaris]